MKYSKNDIYKAFKEEKLEIVDKKQLNELERWALLDFKDHEEDSYVSSSSPVIICGSGRSGTTLARVILDTHTDVYSGAESLLFLPTPIDLDDLSFKFEIEKEELANMLSQSQSRSHFIDQFQQRVLNDNDTRIWADKTARNAHVVPYIMKHFPNAKIIHVIREPKDVVASLKTHKKRKKSNGKITNTGYTMPVSLSIKRWNGAMEDMLPHRNKPYYTEVRYEDLVSKPQEVIEGLCTFLEIDFQEKMLDFHTVKSPTRDYNKFIQNIEATKPLSTTSLGRHLRILTPEEIKQVEVEAAHFAEVYGYKNFQLPKRTLSME